MSEMVAHLVSADDFAVADAQAQHVAAVEEPKVSADGIHPDEVAVLWVAHRNVPRDAFCEADSRPIAEDGGHVHDNVFAVLVEGRE